MLKKNVTNPTDAQLNKALDKIEEELHTITFMYKADRQNTAMYSTKCKMTCCKRKIHFRKL